MTSKNLIVSLIAIVVLTACTSTTFLEDSDRALYNIVSYDVSADRKYSSLIPLVKKSHYNTDWGNWFYGPRDANVNIDIISVYIPDLKDYVAHVAEDAIMNVVIDSAFGQTSYYSNQIPTPKLHASLKLVDAETTQLIYISEIEVDGALHMDGPCNKKANNEKEILELMACRLNVQIQNRLLAS